MAKIYKHVAGGKDDRVGRIDAGDGEVYRVRVGRDTYLGWVDYQEGRVYAHRRLAPDEYLGRVNDEGHIYSHRFGPDQYVGRVEKDGKVYRHVKRGADSYLGQVQEMRHPVEGAAAFLFFLDEPPPEAAAPPEVEPPRDE